MCIANQTIIKVSVDPTSTFPSDSSTINGILRTKSLDESIRSCTSSESMDDTLGSSSSSTSSVPSIRSSSSSGSVRFRNVEVREYNIVIGDNPSCSTGPPVSLGWRYQYEHQDVPLETYEQFRIGRRRASGQMKMPSSVRHEKLREWEVATSDIIKAQTECLEIQKQRLKTYYKVQRNQNIKNAVQRLLCRSTSNNKSKS